MDGKRAGKLLLVEDEHILRGLIAQFLRAEGFEIVEAADGLQGVNLFSALGPFDLILLDLNLPFLPGVEVCRRIKSEQVEQFLSKPYHPLELLTRIAAVIGHGQGPDMVAPLRSSRTAGWRESPGHSPLTAAHTLVKAPILD